VFDTAKTLPYRALLAAGTSARAILMGLLRRPFVLEASNENSRLFDIVNIGKRDVGGV